MNFLQRWILGKELVNQLQQKAMVQIPQRYQIQNGKIVVPVDHKDSYIRDGYSINDIIFSVVNLVLDKVRLPEWRLYKVVDESSLKKYRSLMANKHISGKEYKKALDLKYESLEPIENFNLQLGKLKALLDYPNDTETFQDLTANGCGFKMLTGDRFEWGRILTAGANKGIPQAIELLPSQFTIIKANDEFPVKAMSYELLTWNQKFTKEEILHEKYWNPNWNIAGEQLYGMSALKAALKNTTRNNSAKDASTAKFQNGGLDTIIYMDDPQLHGDAAIAQVNALKVRLAEEYTGPQNQGKRAISAYKTGAVTLGLSPVDLGIIDSEKWDAIMFCNIWGVPPELLGLVQKTYNNVKEAEKALTTRSAIPLLTSRRNSLNRKFQTDWGFKGVNVYVDYDTECFGELRTDMKEVIDSTSRMMMITPNEEREAVGWESRPEPEADEPWVLNGSGRVPLKDFQMNLVDQHLMNDAAVNGQGNNEDGDDKVSADGKGKAGLFSGNHKVNGVAKTV
jgi:HK97 family phage portal protein